MEKHPDPSDDLLRSFLIGRNVPCPNCGYNLRNLQEAICPECGDSITLTVTNQPAHAGGYSAGLTGLTATLVLALGFAVIQVNQAPLLAILSLFVAVWFFQARHRWRERRAAFAQLPRHKKQERVLLCWLGAIILLVLILGSLMMVE